MALAISLLYGASVAGGVVVTLLALGAAGLRFRVSVFFGLGVRGFCRGVIGVMQGIGYWAI